MCKIHKNHKFTNGAHRHSLVYENKKMTPEIYCFTGDVMTHSRFYNCIIENIKFDKAAVTGSIFEKCKFIDCNFNDADFEFCEFRDCHINIKEINNCSFNNSDYIYTTFENILFNGCTFTGTYFDHSTLTNIQIEYSTLEGASFFKSIFRDLDWRYLNLEYVEFIEPSMDNVVFPFFQIPYMFGMLQYLSDTTDSIRISDNTNDMSIDEYFEIGIPHLIEIYKKNYLYFPMSNIYLHGRDTDYNNAYEALSREVSSLSMTRDFRGIKFCCKLLSMCENIDYNQLNKIYKRIIDIDVSLKPNSAEMKSFTRHIGEIRSILYKRQKNPFLKIIMKTNIRIEHKDHFANLMNQFQNLAKPGNTDQIKTTFVLSQNSPLTIDVKVEGNVTLFLPILFSFLILAKSDIAECLSYPLIKSLTEHSAEDALTEKTLQTAMRCKREFERDGIEISLMEYYTEDCEEYLNFNEKNHYIDDNLINISDGSI